MQLHQDQLEETSVIYYVPGPPALSGLLYYPLCVGYFDCKPSYILQRNTYSSYLMIVMMTGSLSYETRHARGVARAGQVLLIDCNTPHSYAAQGKCSFTFVHFDGAQSREVYEELLHRSGGLIKLLRPNDLHESLGEMLSTLRQDRRLNEAQASAMLHGILMQLLEASGAAGSGTVGNSLVDRAIAYIQEHLTDRLTVETIAEHVGYSTGYFSHLFAGETGMSPYQFVVRSRVERAQQLLQTTRLTVQDVAFQCGFNSAANFCYTFRRFTGESPHEFRKRPM